MLIWLFTPHLTKFKGDTEGNFITIKISDPDQIFFTASCHSKNTSAKKNKKICSTKFRARAPSNLTVVKYSKGSRQGFS
jgi:hypothetical protein